MAKFKKRIFSHFSPFIFLFCCVTVTNLEALTQEDAAPSGVRVSNFSSFASAVIAPTMHGKTLLIDSPVQCNNLTVPVGITIKIIDNGAIAVAPGCTLQINGRFWSRPHYVFNGNGIVRFARGSVVEMYPQWWGARADGSTDCYFAIKAMADAVNAAGGGRINFPEGTYQISQAKVTGSFSKAAVTDIAYRNCEPLQIIGNRAIINIKGDFKRSADYAGQKHALKYSYVNAVSPFHITNCRSVLLSGFEIDGNVDQMTRDPGVVESPAHGITIEGGSNIAIKDITVHHCQTDGIYLTGFKTSKALEAARNVFLDRVVSSHNARQGLSVVQARDVMVSDSSFSYSGVTEGQYGGHSPMAGVDVEPNVTVTSIEPSDVITGNITFQRCRFEHNAGSQVTAAYAEKIENVSLKDCTIDATGSTFKYSMILAIKNGLVENSRIETGNGNFMIGWTSSFAKLQKTTVRRSKITGNRNVVMCATEGEVLIEDCSIRNTSDTLDSNIYVPYLVDKNCTFRNNKVFVPRPTSTGLRSYIIVNRLNVRESSNNTFETDLPPGAVFHLASAYGKYTRVINDMYVGAFSPIPSANWKSRKPYNK